MRSNRVSRVTLRTHFVAAVRVLDDIRRMEAHQSKKSARLRRLHLSAVANHGGNGVQLIERDPQRRQEPRSPSQDSRSAMHRHRGG